MHFRLFVCAYFLIYVTSITNAESCKTPNGDLGECTLLSSCPSLHQAFTKKTISVETLRQFICGFEGTDSTKVCCGSQKNPTNAENQSGMKKSKGDLLPSRTYCGYQHSDDFAHDLSSALITEFPWLAQIGYVERGSENVSLAEKEYLCAGSLINNKYVLTSAVCVSSRNHEIVEVRLGEYHVVNETDCVTETGIQECSDPVKTFAIEKIIVHPQYDNKKKLHDIALLRLHDKVTYSDYIRPVCLPYPGTVFANVGDVLVQSGWGYNLIFDKVEIKKRVHGILIPNSECEKAYTGARVKITENHFCTKASENNTEYSCTGDAGAPICFSHRGQWHQEGIVSFGKGICNNMVPDVNTKVVKYLDWIEENIEP